MTLDEIRAAGTPDSFPTAAVAGCRTAAVFFCAGFLGKNDAMHLLDAGIDEAVLVDSDVDRLAGMGAYLRERRGWAIRCDDAFHAARNFASIDRRFDVVTLDPWSQDQAAVLARLPLFAAICDRVLIAGVSATWFAERGLPPTAGALDGWILASCDGLRCVALHHRSDHLGGQWWAVFNPAGVAA